MSKKDFIETGIHVKLRSGTKRHVQWKCTQILSYL